MAAVIALIIVLLAFAGVALWFAFQSADEAAATAGGSDGGSSKKSSTRMANARGSIVIVYNAGKVILDLVHAKDVVEDEEFANEVRQTLDAAVQTSYFLDQAVDATNIAKAMAEASSAANGCYAHAKKADRRLKIVDSLTAISDLQDQVDTMVNAAASLAGYVESVRSDGIDADTTYEEIGEKTLYDLSELTGEVDVDSRLGAAIKVTTEIAKIAGLIYDGHYDADKLTGTPMRNITGGGDNANELKGYANAARSTLESVLDSDSESERQVLLETVTAALKGAKARAAKMGSVKGITDRGKGVAAVLAPAVKVASQLVDLVTAEVESFHVRPAGCWMDETGMCA